MNIETKRPIKLCCIICVNLNVKRRNDFFFFPVPMESSLAEKEKFAKKWNLSFLFLVMTEKNYKN